MSSAYIPSDDRRGFYTRYIAWGTLLAGLFVLLVDRGIGVYDLNTPELLVGLILAGSGFMMLLETMYSRDMEWEDPTSINWLIGVPAALIAIALGAGYLAGYELIVALFDGFEGGIYLAAITILMYEGVTAIFEYNPSLDDFRKD